MTTDAKHTPGPWHVEESNWCGHDKCQYEHVQLTVVGGPCNLPLFSRDTHNYDLQTARADTHLMSAAPDLLTACIEALALISELDPEILDGRDEVPDLLRAAIAKATASTTAKAPSSGA